MTKNKVRVTGEYLLERFPGKGGWTYACIPEIYQNKQNPFGWVTVSGSIDGYRIKQTKLMPMGNGKLFLPVKSEIRKTIGKSAGDTVHIVLSPDESPVEAPDELLECLLNEPPLVYKRFLDLTNGDKKTYIDWIYSSRSDETKAKRIVELIKILEKD